MEERILLSMNHMGGTERRYVADAFDTDWIVPLGPHVDEFEHRLEQFLGCDKRVLALCAGTAAIHLGLILLGVGEGDEVICQALTFSASANPIKYQGAVPVFVDSEPSTMNMDPDALDSAIADRIRVTGRKPKAIVVVDLYGMPADMTRILSVADRYGIPVLEDAAEALGSTYKDQPCGTFGSYAALSFNGNKIITTSGGGALVCPDDVSRKRALFYATQAREDKPYYYHEHIGYNYRLSNVCGAIGCGQMDVLPERVKRRRYIHDIYMAELGSMPGVTVQTKSIDGLQFQFLAHHGAARRCGRARPYPSCPCCRKDRDPLAMASHANAAGVRRCSLLRWRCLGNFIPAWSVPAKRFHPHR